MEEGTRAKRTVFLGGIGDEIDEAAIIEQFSTFGTLTSLCYVRIHVYTSSRLLCIAGDVLEVQIPPAQIPHNNYQNAPDPSSESH